MAKYFGTNGVRGTLETITPDFIVKLCASFATWHVNSAHPKTAPQVLVARDTRTTGELVEGAVVSGLLWAGAQPVLLGVMPTPAVEFLGAKRKLPSIVITSSHNPPEWVALKFNDGRGVALSKERGEEVEAIMEKGVWMKAGWNEIPPLVRDENAINEYKETLKRGCGRLDGLRVVIDTGNGTAGRVAPQVFKGLGAKVMTLNAQEDGFFPGRPSEPTEANVHGLIEAVKTYGADLGIAYDGDGDRVALVDEKGNYVLGDRVFAIAVDIILSEWDGEGGDVVTTVATSSIIREVAKRHGVHVKLTKIGAPYIAEEMERGSYATGGEEVGGIIWPKVHPGKDGILSSVRIANWLIKNNKRLSDVVDALPKYANVKMKIERGEERFEMIKRLQERYKNAKNATLMDGVRLDFDDGWCIARASGTENYIRIFGEARDEKRAKELVEILKKELENLG